MFNYLRNCQTVFPTFSAFFSLPPFFFPHRPPPTPIHLATIFSPLLSHHPALPTISPTPPPLFSSFPQPAPPDPALPCTSLPCPAPAFYYSSSLPLALPCLLPTPIFFPPSLQSPPSPTPAPHVLLPSLLPTDFSPGSHLFFRWASHSLSSTPSWGKKNLGRRAWGKKMVEEKKIVGNLT